MNPADLWAALGGIPALPGAACRGRWELFDPAEPDDIAAATELCSYCPALAACAAWVESLPPRRRPSATVAGRVYVQITPDQTRPRGRPRKEAVA